MNNAAEQTLSVEELKKRRAALVQAQEEEIARIAAAKKPELDELDKQLKDQVKKEKAEKVKLMRADIATYGITAFDLGLGAVVADKPAAGSGSRGTRTPNYVGNEGQLWAGAARGEPEWVTAAGRDKCRISKEDKKLFEAYAGLHQLPAGVELKLSDGRIIKTAAAAE